MTYLVRRWSSQVKMTHCARGSSREPLYARAAPARASCPPPPPPPPPLLPPALSSSALRLTLEGEEGEARLGGEEVRGRGRGEGIGSGSRRRPPPPRAARSRAPRA